MRRTHTRTQSTRASISGAALCATLVFGGCSSLDSYMNPSVTGRWERTPTRVPILGHLAAIEDPEDQWVEISEITAEDLMIQNSVYRVTPGDLLTVTVWDLIVINQPEFLPRQVGPNGYIEIPQIGRVFVSGLTEREVADAISESMSGIIADPLVSVVVDQRREQTFHLAGNVPQPGAYTIPGSDYRMLEGIVAAGGVPEFIREVFVIRQVPLDPDANRLMPEPSFDESDDMLDSAPDGSAPGEDLLDVIDDLSSPGMVSGSRGSLVAPPADAREPMIDLITERPSSPRQNSTNAANASNPAPSGSGDVSWRFRNGQWERTTSATASVRRIDRQEDMSPRDARGNLFTQRVIRVPTTPLMAGDARYNIVIRPGDVIRVPPNPVGNVYIDGQVGAPGVYQLPVAGRMTLTRAITTSGGLNGLAIPERIDLTRIVGNDEQATIMLNLRAIAEGTQPDVYIKPDDRINVGTNFWATPLAILRGGFRTNYGFGFLLDRNFGNDVFGPPPVRNRF